MTTTIIITSIVSILIFSLIIFIVASINEDAGLLMATTVWFPVTFGIAKIIHKIIFTIIKKKYNKYAFYYLNSNMSRPQYCNSFIMTPKMAERFRQSSENETLEGYSIALIRKGKDFKSMPYLKEDLLTEKKIKENYNGMTFEKFLK